MNNKSNSRIINCQSHPISAGCQLLSLPSFLQLPEILSTFWFISPFLFLSVFLRIRMLFKFPPEFHLEILLVLLSAHKPPSNPRGAGHGGQGPPGPPPPPPGLRVPTATSSPELSAGNFGTPLGGQRFPLSGSQDPSFPSAWEGSSRIRWCFPL